VEWNSFSKARSDQLVIEIRCILWYPKVHYIVHKNPSLAPNLSQINPVPSCHPVYSRSILILSSSLQLRLLSSLFPSAFPTKTLDALLLYYSLFFLDCLTMKMKAIWSFQSQELTRLVTVLHSRWLQQHHC